MATMTVIPAYGRDYKSAKAAIEDWNADKDFRIADISSPYDGKYVNKSSCPVGTTVHIRYNRLTRITPVK